MSHRHDCPDRWTAEREGRNAASRGYSRYSNPYKGECDEAARNWDYAYRQEDERRTEERLAEERYAYESARRADEARREEEAYYEQQYAERQQEQPVEEPPCEQPPQS